MRGSEGADERLAGVVHSKLCRAPFRVGDAVGVSSRGDARPGLVSGPCWVCAESRFWEDSKQWFADESRKLSSPVFGFRVVSVLVVREELLWNVGAFPVVFLNGRPVVCEERLGSDDELRAAWVAFCAEIGGAVLERGVKRLLVESGVATLTDGPRVVSPSVPVRIARGIIERVSRGLDSYPELAPTTFARADPSEFEGCGPICASLAPDARLFRVEVDGRAYLFRFGIASRVSHAVNPSVMARLLYGPRLVRPPIVD